MKHLSIFLLLGTGILMLLSACLGGETSLEVKNTSYRIQPPSAPWVSLETQSLEADSAFQNQNTGSSFYIRSSCNLYKDASLKQLTFGLVRQFENPKILSTHSKSLVNRDSQTTVLTGKLDGAPIKVKFTILKKNSCNFDFVFASSPKFFEKDLAAYEKFVDSFSL